MRIFPNAQTILFPKIQPGNLFIVRGRKDSFIYGIALQPENGEVPAGVLFESAEDNRIAVNYIPPATLAARPVIDLGPDWLLSVDIGLSNISYDINSGQIVYSDNTYLACDFVGGGFMGETELLFIELTQFTVDRIRNDPKPFGVKHWSIKYPDSEGNFEPINVITI